MSTPLRDVQITPSTRAETRRRPRFFLSFSRSRIRRMHRHRIPREHILAPAAQIKVLAGMSYERTFRPARHQPHPAACPRTFARRPHRPPHFSGHPSSRARIRLAGGLPPRPSRITNCAFFGPLQSRLMDRLEPSVTMRLRNFNVHFRTFPYTYNGERRRS
jgi:hypothetical protein